MFFQNFSIHKLNRKYLSPPPQFHSNLEYQPELLNFMFRLLWSSCIIYIFFTKIQPIIIFMQKLDTFFRPRYLAGLKSQCYLTGTSWQSNNWHIELTLLTFVRWGTSNSSSHHTFFWNSFISWAWMQTQAALWWVSTQPLFKKQRSMSQLFKYSHSRHERSFLMLGKGHLWSFCIYYFKIPGTQCWDEYSVSLW